MAGDERSDLKGALSRWQLDAAAVRERLYRAPTPRARERWHALWLALRGWSRARVATATALGRDPQTVGTWLADCRRDGPRALACVQTGGCPPALNPAQQAALKAAVQRPPREAGLDLADWHGKVVRRVVSERCGVTLSRSSCLNDLHRLGCVVKRPEKRLLKADEAKRAAFVKEDAALRAEADATGAKHLFVDEAHFYADVDLPGTWVLTGNPALVDSTSPR